MVYTSRHSEPETGTRERSIFCQLQQLHVPQGGGEQGGKVRREEEREGGREDQTEGGRGGERWREGRMEEEREGGREREAGRERERN